MAEIQRFDNFQHIFSFTSHTDEFDLFFSRFLESDLGKIYSSIPWDELVISFGLKESSKGPMSTFVSFPKNQTV